MKKKISVTIIDKPIMAYSEIVQPYKRRKTENLVKRSKTEEVTNIEKLKSYLKNTTATDKAVTSYQNTHSLFNQLENLTQQYKTKTKELELAVAKLKIDGIIVDEETQGKSMKKNDCTDNHELANIKQDHVKNQDVISYQDVFSFIWMLHNKLEEIVNSIIAEHKSHLDEIQKTPWSNHLKEYVKEFVNNKRQPEIRNEILKLNRTNDRAKEILQLDDVRNAKEEIIKLYDESIAKTSHTCSI